MHKQLTNIEVSPFGVLINTKDNCCCHVPGFYITPYKQKELSILDGGKTDKLL